MNFFKRAVYKLAGKSAAAIGNQLDNPMAKLFGAVVSGVLNAEADKGAGGGAAKKAYVLQAVGPAAAALIGIMAEKGHPVKDEEKFTDSIGSMVESVVGILNSSGILKPTAI